MAVQPNKARLWKLLTGLTRGNLVSALGGGLYKPDLGQIQRQSSDGDVTIAADDTLVVFAVDCTGGNRTITMPSAIAGRRIRVIWEVEQATNNRIFTRAGSDTFAGNIFTNEAGNAAGDGDVVAVANTTVTITCVDDVNIGSYLDFHCAADALWLVTGHLVLDADGNVPTLA